MSYMLSDHERAVLEKYLANGTAAEQRRARIILLSADGLPAANIADETGLSTSTVHQWRRKWTDQRLDIFPNYQELASIAVEAETAADDAPEADHSVDAYDVLDAIEADDALMDALDTLDTHAEPAAPIDDFDQLDDSEPTGKAAAIGMVADDPMVEAGRKAIAFHFAQMLAHETGARLGEDIEAVHDMRVATRRMRSAIRVFKPFFKTKAIEPFMLELRRIARALGEVRDLDVFIDKAQIFADEHPEHDLTPLLKAWRKQRKRARRSLIAELDSERFAKFSKVFAKFLSKAGKGAKALPKKSDPTDYEVRHVAPGLIFACYDQIAAYESHLDGASLNTLHALRIDFKRFRYTLEYFEEVLGPEARQIINEVKTMQDHLGNLNDTQVVRASLRAFIAKNKRKAKAKRPDINGVKAYNKAKRAEQNHLLNTFPAAWKNFMRDDVRHKLEAAVAAL